MKAVTPRLVAGLIAGGAVLSGCTTSGGATPATGAAAADKCVMAPIVATRPIDRQTVVVEGTGGSALLHMTTPCVTDRDAQIVIDIRAPGGRLCDRSDASITSVVSGMQAVCQIASVEPLTVAQGYSYKTKAIDRKSW